LRCFVTTAQLLFGVAARAAFTSERRLGALLRELRDLALFYAGRFVASNVNVADLVAVVREFDCDALREFGPRPRRCGVREIFRIAFLYRPRSCCVSFDGSVGL
jgi:hypothetical protein